jgi:hypothetical protein
MTLMNWGLLVKGRRREWWSRYVIALPATRWFQLYFRLQLWHLNFSAILCLFIRGPEMKKL